MSFCLEPPFFGITWHVSKVERTSTEKDWQHPRVGRTPVVSRSIRRIRRIRRIRHCPPACPPSTAHRISTPSIAIETAIEREGHHTVAHTVMHPAWGSIVHNEPPPLPPRYHGHGTVCTWNRVVGGGRCGWRCTCVMGGGTGGQRRRCAFRNVEPAHLQSLSPNELEEDTSIGVAVCEHRPTRLGIGLTVI